MKISKNTFNAKYVMLCNGNNHFLETSLCTYFWQSVWCWLNIIPMIFFILYTSKFFFKIDNLKKVSKNWYTRNTYIKKGWEIAFLFLIICLISFIIGEATFIYVDQWWDVIISIIVGLVLMLSLIGTITGLVFLSIYLNDSLKEYNRNKFEQEALKNNFSSSYDYQFHLNKLKREKKEKKKFNLIRLMWKANKEKVCPRIEWID